MQPHTNSNWRFSPTDTSGSGTNTPVPTSTPRPVGGSCLQSSDPIPNEENAHMYNSFTGIAGQVEPQKPTRLESNDKPVGSDNSASTGNTTLFYPGEIPFKNQGKVHHHGSM